MSTTLLDAGSVREEVRALAPTIAARAREVEELRRVPLDLVDDLVAAGCLRLLVPRSHGGLEMDLGDALGVVSDLARVDGSIGWTVALGSEAPLVLGLLPRSTFDALYADDPDIRVAAVFNPTGTAIPVSGGFRLSGRWRYASGCLHCDWFIGHSVVTDGRTPPVRMALVPRSAIRIDDTWDTVGMSGTGSHDVVVDDVEVPDDHTFCLGGPSSIDGPLWRLPEVTVSALVITNVALGIARGAFDDIMALATDKVPAFDSSVLAASPWFRTHLADVDARLRAAQAVFDAEVDRVWTAARAGRELSLVDRAHVRAVVAWVTTTAASVVDSAYTAGGATSLSRDHPLQRRFRDVHAVTQHFLVKPDSVTAAGAVLLGQDVDTTLL